MKIRLKFVSNSSSSSFHLFGICISPSFSNIKLTEKGKDILSKEWDYEFNEEEKINGEILETIFEKQLRVIPDRSCGDFYIGLGLEKGRDDQTFGEFKQNIRDIINSLLIGETPFYFDNQSVIIED